LKLPRGSQGQFVRMPGLEAILWICDDDILAYGKLFIYARICKWIVYLRWYIESVIHKYGQLATILACYIACAWIWHTNRFLFVVVGCLKQCLPHWLVNYWVHSVCFYFYLIDKLISFLLLVWKRCFFMQL